MNTEQKEFMLSGERCPNCRERLFPADLEMFPRCPYCDHIFPQGNQLEDFILKPVLQRWVTHTYQQFPR